MTDDLKQPIEAANFQAKFGGLEVLQLDFVTFAELESGTLLGRLFDEWNTGVVSKSGGVVPPNHTRFNPRQLLTGPEQWLVFSINPNDEHFSKRLESSEEDVIACYNPFYFHTFSYFFQCVAAKAPIYLLLKLELEGELREIYRLMLPTISDRDEVLRVDVVNRLVTPPLRIIENHVAKWTT